MAEDGALRQNKRIVDLWKSLDSNQKGQLNFDDLRTGLRDTDHRAQMRLFTKGFSSLILSAALKDAGGLLYDVFKRVDLNSDGIIYFNGADSLSKEFSTFVKHAEDELSGLFRNIDRNHNGKLTREELRVAFIGAGVPIAPARLDEFFSTVDRNHDGVITWEEWR
ncbi:MAG: hypothetical protein Q9159_005286 [Coniocarpon cinnabarinum]